MRKLFLVFIASAVALSMEVAIAGPLAVPSSPAVSSDNPMLVTVAKRKMVKKKKTVTRKKNSHGKTVKKTTTHKKTVKKNYNNNHRYNARVTYRRPYRAWNRRPYYGSVVAGVTIGTVLVVSASRVPVQPDPDLCWYWSNNAMTSGYWDYCVPR